MGYEYFGSLAKQVKPETLTLQETRSIYDPINRPKLNSLLIHVFTFYNKYLKFKKRFFNLGIKTVLYLKYNRINGFLRM